MNLVNKHDTSITESDIAESPTAFSKFRKLLEKLAGQPAPLEGQEWFSDRDIGKPIGYSQLNEVLLLFGFDRINREFFQFLIDGNIDYEPGNAFESLTELEVGIDRFRRLAILLYGNVKFAFKYLSTNPETLVDALNSDQPIDPNLFFKRHDEIFPVDKISAGDTYLTGYLIERQIEENIANAIKGPWDELESRRKKIVTRAKINQTAYLVSDHLDVYVATSMREQYEFEAISTLTKQIFGHAELIHLKLRYFDPTQAYCTNRIDKGLAEALMLRRAKCTIYLAQESDTLGKDSELASTLAQGKPVVAFIPEITDESFQDHIGRLLKTSTNNAKPRTLLDQLFIYNPKAAWENEKVRGWCENPVENSNEELKAMLQVEMHQHYDQRAKTLKETHPLGIQVNLSTGVGNGVLVVRKVADCAKLIRKIMLNTLELNIEETEDLILLREKISGCIFRVVTRNDMLTNSFWNFYLRLAK